MRSSEWSTNGKSFFFFFLRSAILHYIAYVSVRLMLKCVTQDAFASLFTLQCCKLKFQQYDCNKGYSNDGIKENFALFTCMRFFLCSSSSVMFDLQGILWIPDIMDTTQLMFHYSPTFLSLYQTQWHPQPLWPRPTPPLPWPCSKRSRRKTSLAMSSTLLSASLRPWPWCCWVHGGTPPHRCQRYTRTHTSKHTRTHT